LRSSRADQIADDYQPSCDAYARLKGRVGLEGTYGRDRRQPRSHSPLCVVLVGLGVAEVNQDPVAHVLCYEATEALHGIGNGRLNDLPQILWVHAG
jgi:hypothetical protein